MNDADPGFFAGLDLFECRVAILGLGLMGGSLALALKGRCRAILGSDPDPAALALAHKRQVADLLSADPAELLPQADLVVLAAPVRAILGLLASLPRLHPGSPVVMDLGSTKRTVVAAMGGLPERFDPLGGHPMCGRERGTLAAADAGLFQGRTFALTALPRTSSHACRLAEQLVRTLGAQPLWLDPETHDRWTASSSHLPYLAANALAAVTPPEVAPMVGTGFLSTTRLAVSPVEMMMDVVLTNRENVLTALERLRGQLERLEISLKQNNETALRAALLEGAARRELLVPPSAN
jgi:prephenate dehydrogenase